MYIARSMLALVIDTFFIDDEVCAVSTKKGSEISEKPGAKEPIVPEPLKITLYPNPAKDYVMLHMNSADPEVMQLTITDVLGREIVNTKAGFINGNYQLDTKTYGNGLYYVTLFKVQTKVFSDKLIILGK